jgi:uncharacterized membrane protein YphA (DoxX/SURF4 family)
MDMAESAAAYPAIEVPAWKSVSSAVAAVVLGLLFLSSGIWKVTDPLGWEAKVIQLKFPGAFAMALTLALGSLEIFGGALLLVPRFRRWGAWLTGFLLVVFMAYVGINYTELTGADCSCFPWLKRAVGPGFFIGDAAMLLLALIAGIWGVPSFSRRGAALMLAAILVFTGASYGVTIAQQSGIEAPKTVTVDGKEFSLTVGRIYLFFYDPSCMHCKESAERMVKYKWTGGVKVLAVPTTLKQFAAQFLKDTALDAPFTNDSESLRNAFTFTDPPYAVALEYGRQKAAFVDFTKSEPESALRKLGWIE